MNVSTVALVMSVICGIAGIAILFRTSPRLPSVATVTDGPIGELAKLIEALAKLAESLTKAGPGIALLVVSVFFMLIAALASGVH
jgi:hypothetical protein